MNLIFDLKKKTLFLKTLALLQKNSVLLVSFEFLAE